MTWCLRSICLLLADAILFSPSLIVASLSSLDLTGVCTSIPRSKRLRWVHLITHDIRLPNSNGCLVQNGCWRFYFKKSRAPQVLWGRFTFPGPTSWSEDDCIPGNSPISASGFDSYMSPEGRYWWSRITVNKRLLPLKQLWPKILSLKNWSNLCRDM